MTIQRNETSKPTTMSSAVIDLLRWDKLWVYILYVCQSIIVGGSNFMVAMSILRYQALRLKKHCLIIFGLSFADSINQFAFLAAGIYRMCLIFMGTHNSFRTPIGCMVTPHTVLWSYSETLASLMLVVVSIDRLLSVAWPLRYIKWDATKYVMQTVGLAYIYVLVTGLGGSSCVAFNQPQNQTLPAICFIEDVLGTSPMYLKYYMNVSSVFGVSSVVIYFFVWVTYRQHTLKVAAMTTGNEEKSQLPSQYRLTVSLGISSLCTLFLSVIPLFFGHLFAANHGYAGLSMASFLMSSLNPLANVIIYWKRQKNIRKAIKSMLQGKELLPDTRLWYAYNTPRAPGAVRVP